MAFGKGIVIVILSTCLHDSLYQFYNLYICLLQCHANVAQTQRHY